MKRIKVVGPTVRKIKDVGPTQPKIRGEEVVKALGAKRCRRPKNLPPNPFASR